MVMAYLTYLTDNLKKNYTAVVQSDTDKSFYKNVHRYIDFIVNTPVLAEIMNKSEDEYKQKHTEIWSVHKHTEEELDEQDEKTRKLEKFSLYASDYCWIFERIYRPLEIYENTEELTGKYAICSNLMLGQTMASKNNPQNIKSFSKWYVGKRAEYENRLKLFHQDFLPIVEKIKETPEPEDSEPEIEPVNIPVVQKIEIKRDVVDSKGKVIFSFSNRTGDFRYYDTAGTLPLGGQEYKVFSVIYNLPDYQAPYLDLINSYSFGDGTYISKGCRDNLSLIIRNIKNQFKILPHSKKSNPNIFLNIKKYGYRLVFSPDNKRTE